MSRSLHLKFNLSHYFRLFFNNSLKTDLNFMFDFYLMHLVRFEAVDI